MQEHNHARQEIAAQLRQVRKEQGMTQERLAEKVGTRKLQEDLAGRLR